MPDDVLKKEIEYFEAHRQELLQRAEGKYALIKDDKFIDFFDSVENAYARGAFLFGNVPFLIRQILEEDPVFEVPAYSLGIL